MLLFDFGCCHSPCNFLIEVILDSLPMAFMLLFSFVYRRLFVCCHLQSRIPQRYNKQQIRRKWTASLIRFPSRLQILAIAGRTRAFKFIPLCMCVCMSLCVCVCVSALVQKYITDEASDTFFFFDLKQVKKSHQLCAFCPIDPPFLPTCQRLTC